jgi:hypothetical protein
LACLFCSAGAIGTLAHPATVITQAAAAANFNIFLFM